MGLANTTLRIGLGTLMTGHGLQKLAGKFGGPGLDGTTAGFERMGFSPARPYATAAALTETVGGGLLATGFLTPLGAAMITGAMTVAIGKVHAKNGVWVSNGGAEFNLLIIGSAFAATEGAGFPALDGLVSKRRSGFGWAVAQLVAGVAGGAAVMSLANRGAGKPPDAISSAASSAADTVSHTAHSTADSVSHTAHSTADKVSDGAQTAADKVSDTAQTAADKVSNGAEDALAPSEDGAS